MLGESLRNMRNNSVDKKKIREAVRLLLEAIGDDPDRDGLRKRRARGADV